MKLFTSTATATATALGTGLVLPLALAVPAEAVVTAGCVEHSEFEAVRYGMTKARVHEVFDTRGELTSSRSGALTRQYDTCEGHPDFSWVEVDYAWRNGAYRLVDKGERLAS